MTEFDWNRPFIEQEAMDTYEAIDQEAARMYGKKIRATEFANHDYKLRYSKLRKRFNMKPPPSCGRIFAGYIVVRKLGSPEQYETWMPDHVFEELYIKCPSAS